QLLVFIWENCLRDTRHCATHENDGAFEPIARPSRVQDSKQTHLSKKPLGAAQKHMLTFTSISSGVDIFFLCVGALLYFYADANGINIADLGKSDYLYPEIALRHLGLLPGIVFMMGLTAATFATTDSALTALTTSYCVDFLGFNKKENPNDPKL